MRVTPACDAPRPPMIVPQARTLHEAVLAALELRALEAEDECADAIHEARAALPVLRLLRLLEACNAAVAGDDERADAGAAAALAQLNEDLCDALRARSVPVIDRVAAAVREELAVRGAGAAAEAAGLASFDKSCGGRILIGDQQSHDASESSEDVWAEPRGYGRAVKRARRGVRGSALALKRAAIPGRRRTTVERALCASVVAWALAFLGVGAVWLRFTLQFVDAQRHPVVQRELVQSDALVIPALTFCPSMGPSLPTFYDFPTSEFRGSPWLTVRLYADNSQKGIMEYPDTKGLIRDTVVTTGDAEACERETAVLDPSVHVVRVHAPKGTLPRSECQRCITVGLEKRVVVERVASPGFRAAEGLRMEIVSSMAPNYCFYPQSKRGNSRVLEYIQNELINNFDELIDRGTLALHGADYNASFLLRKRVEPAPVRSAHFRRSASFFCGVYLFSGLWYPTSTSNVSWAYNLTGTGWWEQSNGPSVVPYFNATSMNDIDVSSKADPKDVATHVRRSGRRRNVTLNMFVTDVDEPLNAKLNTSDQAAMLLPDALNVIRPSKEIGTDGYATYSARSSGALRLRQPLVRGKVAQVGFHRYVVDVTFGSFMVPNIQSRKSYEASEYLADLANVFDIFIGQSVFALVVLALTAATVGRWTEFVQSAAPSR